MIDDILIDGARVLHRFARADKLRNAIGIPAHELRDRRFGDHQACIVHAEVVLAGDHAGLAIHHDAVAMLGLDVEDDRPALAVRVARPVVVRDHDLAVFGVAARGDEGGAAALRDESAARSSPSRSC